MGTITVMLCTNDPDNGIDTGRCCAVNISCHEDSIDLECQYGDWSPRCTDIPGGIRFARRKFKATGHQNWVGNWCWDAVQMEPSEALRFANYLRELGWYCDKAETRFFDLWRLGNAIDMETMAGAISLYAGDHQ